MMHATPNICAQHWTDLLGSLKRAARTGYSSYGRAPPCLGTEWRQREVAQPLEHVIIEPRILPRFSGRGMPPRRQHGGVSVWNNIRKVLMPLRTVGVAQCIVMAVERGKRSSKRLGFFASPTSAVVVAALAKEVHRFWP